MSTIRTKEAYREANLNRFKAAISCPEAKQPGNLIPTLIKLGFDVSRVGKTTTFRKGRAIISYKGGTNLAEVTLCQSHT